MIQRLKDLVSQEGKDLVLVNIEAERDPKVQFDKYMQAVELVRNKVECVVSTSLPGEELIFWPFYDVQFNIRDDKEEIGATGSPEIIQKVFNVNDREVNTTLPGLDYWKGRDLIYELDTTDYIDEQRLLAGEIELNSQELIEEFGYRQTKPFENEDWWYALKFFFTASEFNNLDGFEVKSNEVVLIDTDTKETVKILANRKYSPQTIYFHDQYRPQIKAC